MTGGRIVPLSYHDVMTADLSPLSDVSKTWQKMAKRFGELKLDYEKHVQRALANGSWQGQSFGAHQTSSMTTAFEYAAAGKEALAIASLLAEAHTDLTALQKAVKDLTADAEAKDYKIDSSGRATYVGFDKLSAKDQQALHSDPHYPRLLAQAEQTAQVWTDAITTAVRAVYDADQVVQQALTRAAGPSVSVGNPGGFNANAEGDLAKAGVSQEASGAATKTDGWTAKGTATATGPDAGFSVSGPAYGKEGTLKAYADLGHATAQGSLTNGSLKLSGTADIYAGGRATANAGITNKGISGQAEVSVGVRALVEGRVEYGPVGGYSRATGFAGVEGSANAKAGKDGVSVGAKVFAGAKAGVANGVEVGGIGFGGTAEGWAGPGAEAKWGYEKGDDGKFRFGGSIGVSPGLGGDIGFEITVDPKKVSETAEEAADALGDGARKIGHAANSAKHAAGSAVSAITDLF